jgi:hypothetical protein
MGALALWSIVPTPQSGAVSARRGRSPIHGEADDQVSNFQSPNNTAAGMPRHPVLDQNLAE